MVVVYYDLSGLVGCKQVRFFSLDYFNLHKFQKWLNQNKHVSPRCSATSCHLINCGSLEATELRIYCKLKSFILWHSTWVYFYSFLNDTSSLDQGISR